MRKRNALYFARLVLCGCLCGCVLLCPTATALSNDSIFTDDFYAQLEEDEKQVWDIVGNYDNETEDTEIVVGDIVVSDVPMMFASGFERNTFTVYPKNTYGDGYVGTSFAVYDGSTTYAYGRLNPYAFTSSALELSGFTLGEFARSSVSGADSTYTYIGTILGSYDSYSAVQPIIGISGDVGSAFDVSDYTFGTEGAVQLSFNGEFVVDIGHDVFLNLVSSTSDLATEHFERWYVPEVESIQITMGGTTVQVQNINSYLMDSTDYGSFTRTHFTVPSFETVDSVSDIELSVYLSTNSSDYISEFNARYNNSSGVCTVQMTDNYISLRHFYSVRFQESPIIAYEVIDMDSANLSWFQRIWQAIQNVVTGIAELPSRFLQAIKDGITALFVPDAEYVATYKEDFNTMIQTKLGFIYDGSEMVSDGITTISNSFDQEAVPLTMPSVDLPINGETYTIIEEQEVEMNNNFMNVVGGTLATIVMLVSTIAVIRLCGGMVASFISGDSWAQWLRGNKIRGDDD